VPNRPFRLFPAEYAVRDACQASPRAKSAPPSADFATPPLTENIIPINVKKAD
jgi:hypothetical protein